MIALLAGLAHAATLLVAADGTGDHTSIQAAIDAAAAGDVVQVRDGVYVEGRDVGIVGAQLVIGKSITVVGQSVDGVVVTSTLPAQLRMTAVLFTEGTYDATVDGLTFEHTVAGTEGGIYAYSAVQIGEAYNGVSGDLVVRNAVFRMPAGAAKSLTYVNSNAAPFTLSHVTADFGTTTAGAFAYVNYVDPTSVVTDSILLNANCGWIYFGDPWSQLYQVRHTDSWGCGPATGTGNVNVDPLVVDRAGGDYRLQAGSPVADAGSGSPATDPAGGPADLGVHGASRADVDALEWQTGLAARITNPTATLAFEDVVDETSDEDLNDQVLRHVASCRVGAVDGRLLDQVVDFAPVAAGATEVNALRLRPTAVPDRVRWSVDGGATLEICGPDTAPCTAEIALYDDYRDAFEGAPTGFVNTQGPTIRVGRGHTLRLEWAAGPVVGGSCPEPDFVLARPDDGVLVDDASALPDGVPLAGRFPGEWAVPTERTAVGVAYPGLIAWLDEVSAGCPCPSDDWYTAPGSEVVTRTDLATTAPLTPPPTCDDALWNQDERATDCGGTVCPACP